MSDVIAIDGPSASGKSTVARETARCLDYYYVDSGALYRAVTWFALRDGLDPRDSRAVEALAAGLEPEFFVMAGAVRFKIRGVQLSGELRTVTVNEAVSVVSGFPGVRACVVAWLRDMSRLGPLVVEGRDIGTVVFPGARRKFFLDASEGERARRRHAQTEEVGTSASVADVELSLKRRDSMDTRRAVAPLAVAPDAIIVDSTGMTIDDVVSFVLENSGKP